MRAVAALFLLLLTACGGRPGLVGAGAGDHDAAAGAADAGAAGDACDPRIPINHRTAGSDCPAARGPGWTSAGACPPDGGFLTCLDDSKCTQGTNGRCFGGPFACSSSCTYDTCASDSDCPASEPCACRASASDSTPNACATGSNCRVDTDCGPCGFCSPSLVNNYCQCMSPDFCEPDSGSCSECDANGCTQVSCTCGGNCGHGYFCHTPQDTCVNDSDCPVGNTCNYYVPSGLWRCTGCMPFN
jgi:hypothetical protein